ncbi:MARVEL domain-containing protein 2 [Varanus komodoensis]|uniref:MARVEL domain-containing protein 2-like n=1 Tax=Varanus komodoensis TaxID=61221 RepID=UPI001CF76BBA|nr:MARVEL domain-containing protein 2-like [Varanus komodoensis]KAF7235919.1 MARVEL domain-containing protein 2 [Varanus komodoensis]
MAAEDDPLQPLSWGQTTGGQPHPMEASTKDPGTSLVPRSSPSCGVLPSASSSQAQEWPLLKPVRRFAPPSAATAEADQVKPPLLTCSPEGAPLVHPWSGCPRRTAFAARECSSDGENESPPSDAAATPTLGRPPAAMDQGSRPTAPPSYEEKLEAYNQKYSYMKSWPGLLRLMGALELIFGGMVFACTAAYIQKDYQWPQLYGDFAGAGYGYGYVGPMAPFVLVVASLAWLVTVILLGLGVTMYYRTILLNSHWWPLTEFALNLTLSLLYMAAAIAYVNDVRRGGLCYSVFAANPLVMALCQVEGGQVAAIVFLFLTMLLYLGGSFTCLKMWQREAIRKRLLSLPTPVVLRAAPQLAASRDDTALARKATRHVEFLENGEVPERLNLVIPTGHNPKPHIVPDYVINYPSIGSMTEREKYKAVFNDLYAEYKELYREISAAEQKFQDLDAMMRQLPRHYQNRKEQSRLSAVRKEYRTKRKDPAYLEKQQRRDYLKRKLAHLKAQIQAYDWEAGEGSVAF